MIVFNKILPATNSTQFLMDWSTNNGTGYLSSGYLCGVTSNAYNSATIANTNSTATCPLTPTSTVSSTDGLNGQIILTGITAGTSYCGYTGQIYAATTFCNVYGVNSGTTAINNIRFSMLSGNIASGTITLYGIIL